jgi:hypothetical protein
LFPDSSKDSVVAVIDSTIMAPPRAAGCTAALPARTTPRPRPRPRPRPAEVLGSDDEDDAEAAAAAAAAAALLPRVFEWTLMCRFFSSDLGRMLEFLKYFRRKICAKK